MKENLSETALLKTLKNFANNLLLSKQFTHDPTQYNEAATPKILMHILLEMKLISKNENKIEANLHEINTYQTDLNEHSSKTKEQINKIIKKYIKEMK